VIDVSLGPAQPRDVDGIVAVFLACWRRAYRGVLDDAVIDRWDASSARRLWAANLTEASAGRVMVVRREGDVVGVVRYGPDPDHAHVGAVHSLYVHPDAGRAGIGRRLLGAAEAELAADGCARARLWVFAANEAAIAFYRHAGWRADGRTRVEEAFGAPEIGFARELGAGRDG
jgi:ribosomal protein S18 acetylase RimI-like enzyme